MTAALAMHDLGAWPGYRVPHIDLLPRAWELRGRLRTWDALYVALAERLECPLVTLDRRMGRVQQIRCPVETQ
jgi:predicted nucleic acid-binding protein